MARRQKPATPLIAPRKPMYCFTDDVTAQLFWINGRIINSALSDPRNALSAFAVGALPPARRIDEFYLRTLSRPPTDAEQAFWQAELPGADVQQKRLDFAWALLSSRDFVTNH
jgi:hypothetical protein